MVTEYLLVEEYVDGNWFLQGQDFDDQTVGRAYWEITSPYSVLYLATETTLALCSGGLIPSLETWQSSSFEVRGWDCWDTPEEFGQLRAMIVAIGPRLITDGKRMRITLCDASVADPEAVEAWREHG